MTGILRSDAGSSSAPVPRSSAISRSSAPGSRQGLSLQPVPRNATVAGVPAKVVGSAGAEPARQMDQLLSMMEGIRTPPPDAVFPTRRGGESPGLFGVPLSWQGVPRANTERIPCGEDRDGESRALPAADVRKPLDPCRCAAEEIRSAEVYIGEEFVGVLFVDDEDGDRSFNFTMAILDTDLED